MRWVGLFSLGVALGMTTLAAPAEAQRASERRQAIEQLGSRDAAEVQGALETLGVLGDPRAARPIAERIRRGLPPPLLDIAIATLSVLGSRDAGPVLLELTHHRRPAVRVAAVQAIAATRPAGGERALASALADAEEGVRAAAALALGEMGASGALDPLFQALERGIPEAATAIGQLARAAEIERFLGYLGRLSFELVTPALREMLLRDDLAERARLTIVRSVAELASPGARAFLEQLVDSLPDSAVRRAAEDATSGIAR